MEKINPKMGLLTRRKDFLVGENPPPKKGAPKGPLYKSIVLDVLAVASAGAMGFLYRSYLEGDGGFISPLVVLAIFFVVSIFGSIFEKTGRRMVVIFLETAAFTGFFYGVQLGIVVGAGVVFLAFSLLGEMGSRLEIANALGFKFTRAAKPKVARLFTGVAIAAIVLAIPYWSGKEVLLGEGHFQKLYGEIAAVTQTLYPDVNITSTVGNFARSAILPRLFETSGLEEFPPDVQDRAIDAAVSQSIGRAAESFGISLNADMSLSEAVYAYVTNALAGWREQLGITFFVLWAVVVFLVVRSIGIVFIWGTLIVAYFFYEILSVVGAVKIEGESRTKEVAKFT